MYLLKLNQVLLTSSFCKDILFTLILETALQNFVVILFFSFTSKYRCLSPFVTVIIIIMSSAGCENNDDKFTFPIIKTLSVRPISYLDITYILSN
jgi:hypothetical protein